jgi:hypothetical protein
VNLIGRGAMFAMSGPRPHPPDPKKNELLRRIEQIEVKISARSSGKPIEMKKDEWRALMLSLDRYF